MNSRIAALKSIVEAVLDEQSSEVVESSIKAFERDFSESSDFTELAAEVFELSRRYYAVKERGSSELDKLSLEERIELEQVEKIIDGNLLTYHFQPIVSAVDGSIYSYEALMRPVGAPLISPYHILKYAALMGRLIDIERATLLNVLGIIDRELEKFRGRMVFINSIPNIVLPADDAKLIGELLVKHSDTAVIEMTEHSELDERKIEMLKDHYRTLNVRIAIDDYGTGYSNVKNLLDYMPNYVKIDRSLLSDIQNSSKKRHFVRDIVDFCHDNSILALAEGVETAEELRTVILLGVDLIQGYYTARPCPEVIDKIDPEVIAEILRFRDELRDGIASKQYSPKPGEKVQLDALARDGVSAIFIGKDFQEGDSVTLCGSPSSDTPISITCLPTFKGTLTIDAVRLLSIRNRPCITLSEGSRVTLEISGENRLISGGIQVPFRSELRVVGHGALYIRLDNSEYFGIGNDLSTKHGKLIFEHNSMITIDANGQRGIGIGSGSGGEIEIHSGKYLIKLQGSYCVAVGSFQKNVKLDIRQVDLQTKLSAAKCTAIGSLYSNAEVKFWGASVRCFLSGLTAVAFGTADGDKANVNIENSNVTVDIRADEITAVGSLKGRSDISITKASFSITAAGHEALAFGGVSGDTTFTSDNADVSVDLTTNYDTCTFAPPEGIFTTGGRCAFTVNGHTEDTEY